eukprot:g8982.t1
MRSRSRAVAAVLAVAVVDGGAHVLADRPRKTAAPAKAAPEEAAAEFLRASGAVLPPPDDSKQARRRQRKAETRIHEGLPPPAPPANESPAATPPAPSDLRAERRAWRSRHHHGVDVNGTPRRRLDGGDGGDGGTSSDRSGGDDVSDEEADCSGCETDDALDPTKPASRPRLAYRQRREAARRERRATEEEPVPCQMNNGETNLAGKFHKTLPHDEFGRVDEGAFQALEDCIYSGEYGVCEAVPAGEPTGCLVNPTGGRAVDMAGPASSSTTIPSVPTLETPELAAQLAECYWMALARDVPFADYDTANVTVAAAENLAEMPGFADGTGVAVRDDGSVDPSSQLFRASFVGVETGPMVSQLLVNDFTMDSITVAPKQATFAPGVDYMTSHDDWLFVQNGGAPESPEEMDSEKRYVRNARDLARLVATDTIYTEAFRGALILMDQGAISRGGFNGPYADEKGRQQGFVEYGTSHVMKVLGSCEGAQRSAWYQKWNVHLTARPEALAGTLHHLLKGDFGDDNGGPVLHESLLGNWELLNRVAAANREQNRRRDGGEEGGEETYLLSQATAGGSPAHPSYPAGHAVQNGAFATVLKALVGYERGENCFTAPVYPDDDGLELLEWDGECLTYEGEINKLATNVAIGRQMMGVHYRFDSTEGLILGETVAVRMLHQELMAYPEASPYRFRLFTGEVIMLFPDGSFAIDGNDCSREVYNGMEPGKGYGRGLGVGRLDLDSAATATAGASPHQAGGGARWRGRAAREEFWQDQAARVEAAEEERHWEAGDVSECILLFGAFCNGNMGDVVQPISMEHLLASVLPPEQCYYYAHPVDEDPSRKFSMGKFFGRDESKVIALAPTSAWKVNNFKAFVIGGGGIFSDKHPPLYFDSFVEELTLPIVVMGVGASYRAKQYRTLLQKAVFVSGRDTTTTERFATILAKAASPALRPEDVRLVRDPVLSDEEFTDNTGSCWRQSKGDNQQLCFVLTAATTQTAIMNHEQFRQRVVRPGDRVINVFPKHQAGIEKFEYPATIEEILDPMEFVTQLCSCKAIISSRFHGAILGLHMGVPTFGAFHLASENKVPELMMDTMALPDQFFLIDENFTREGVDRQVDAVRKLYEDDGRRGAIHDRLSVLHDEFTAEARHMLDVVGIPQRQTSVPVPQLVFKDSTPPPQARGVPETSGERGRVASVAAIGADVPSTPTMTPPLPSSPPNPAEAGQGSLVAVFLLFAIAGQALLPSKDGGRKGGRGSSPQGASEGAAVDGTTKVSRETTSVRALAAALGVTFSSYSKSYLQDTHDPIGLLALQGVSGSLILFALGRMGMGSSDAVTHTHGDAIIKARNPSALREPVVSAGRRETLAAIMHTGQAVLTNFSLSVGGVAATNALKAMEPVAAALFSYLLLGKRVAPGGMTALVIIVAGILLLTSGWARGGGHKDVGEATDTGEGSRHLFTGRILVSAVFTMAAVSCNALRNVVIKKGDPIPPHRTLFTCSVAAGVIGMALMLLRLIFRRMDELTGGEDSLTEGGVGDSHYDSWMSMDGINAALCFVGYNFASFNLLARLSPVGHAVGNSVKRVVMFGSGIVLMGEVMSARQLAGAGVALLGVGVYTFAVKR